MSQTTISPTGFDPSGESGNPVATFSYNNQPVTFRLQNGDVMVNLTQMAKLYGKETTHFLQNKRTREFIAILDAILGFSSTEVTRGGNTPGTWAHQKLAIKFAAWLDPKFELWVYDRVEELMRQGYTKIDTISRKKLLLMMLELEEKAERLAEENKKLHVQLSLQNEQLKLATPKIDYHDEVMRSRLAVLTLIAKTLAKFKTIFKVVKK